MNYPHILVGKERRRRLGLAVDEEVFPEIRELYSQPRVQRGSLGKSVFAISDPSDLDRKGVKEGFGIHPTRLRIRFLKRSWKQVYVFRN